MPKGLKEMESHIRTSGRSKGLKGKELDRYVYGRLNNEGYMKGSKVTAKGKKVKT